MLPKMSYSTLLIRETTMKISLEDAQNAKEQLDHPAILYYSGEQTHSKGSKVAHYRDTCLPACLCYTALLTLALSQSQLLCP